MHGLSIELIRVRGVNSLAKHPERVGTGPKDKKRLQTQLTWQNRPKKDAPVPPLPGAREGRGSLELVEIFQMRPSPGRFTPVCRSRCGTRGRTAVPAPGGSYGQWDHSPCVVLLVQANRNHTSDRAMGPAAESTLSGMGRPCRWALWLRRALDR